MNVRHPVVFYDKMGLRLFIPCNDLFTLAKGHKPFLSSVAMTRKYITIFPKTT